MQATHPWRTPACDPCPHHVNNEAAAMQFNAPVVRDHAVAYDSWYAFSTASCIARKSRKALMKGCCLPYPVHTSAFLGCTAFGRGARC